MRLLRINNKNRNSLEGICKFVNKIDFFLQYLDGSLRPHSLRAGKTIFLYSFVPQTKFQRHKRSVAHLLDDLQQDFAKLFFKILMFICATYTGIIFWNGIDNCGSFSV